MRLFRTFVVFDMALVLVLIGFLAVQRSLLFPAVSQSPPKSMPPGVVQLDLPSQHVPPQHVKSQYALYLKPNRPGQTSGPSGAPADVVLFFHGNAEVAGWSVAAFDDLRAEGIGIVLMEYPGYGGNLGKPSAESMVGAALTLFDEVASWPDVENIYVFGRSMGGGVATAVASEREVSGVILASTFMSLHRLVYQKRLPAFLLLDRFYSQHIVASLDVPVLVYHGTQDRLIPFEHGEQLAAAAADGHLLTFACGHNNCPIPSREIIDWMKSGSE